MVSTWASEATVQWLLLGKQSLLTYASVTCGALGAMGLACTGVPVSLVIQGEGSRSCSGWSLELQVSMCARKQDLPPREC
jgi:hypothetical protein